jgi:hypothetical protein
MTEISTLIADTIERHADPAGHADLAQRVAAITARFPVPGLQR